VRAAALAAAFGNRGYAAGLLAPVANRAPGRSWLVATLAKYR
jgi:hypothetical protein